MRSLHWNDPVSRICVWKTSRNRSFMGKIWNFQLPSMKHLKRSSSYNIIFAEPSKYLFYLEMIFREKTRSCTLPHQCHKSYHTQTFNNDFKKWLWTSSFLDAVHTVIIQIACDLWASLATTTSSHCSVKLTPQTVAVVLIEHEGADYSLINLKATSTIT